MPNGEIVRWIWQFIYLSIAKDAIFCFCCKLFRDDAPPFRRGTSTWEGMSKKLKAHEIGETHQKFLSSWLNLRQAIVHRIGIDDQELQITGVN
jgi:hypothetical protein